MRNSSATNQLIERVRVKEAGALETLFGRHSERLRKMVRLRLDARLRGRISSSVVLEAVSEEASHRLEAFLADPSGSFFLWLRRLTDKHLQELHAACLGPDAREGGQQLQLQRGASPEVNAGALAARLLGEKGANAEGDRAELLVQLQTALNGMDALDREILALRNFEELTPEEAADVLGMTRAAVTIQHLRALKRLNEVLRSIPGFFPSP
jgi:RNA polymerase sigma-70 factor (ECF subfamily)